MSEPETDEQIHPNHMVQAVWQCFGYGRCRIDM
jgi:hypothetical protein